MLRWKELFTTISNEITKLDTDCKMMLIEEADQFKNKIIIGDFFEICYGEFQGEFQKDEEGYTECFAAYYMSGDFFIKVKESLDVHEIAYSALSYIYVHLLIKEYLGE